MPSRRLQDTSVSERTQLATRVARSQVVVKARPDRRANLPANGSALFKMVYGSEGANREYTDFCQDLAALLAGGMPAAEAIVHASRTAGPGLQRICAAAAGPVSLGMPLHRALAPYASDLPDVLLPILEAGERAGTTEYAVRQLAETFRKGVATGHRFEYHVAGVSSFFGAAASEFSPGRASRGQRRTVSDSLRLTLPLLGFAGRCFAGARWARSFSTLWNQGVPVSQGLEASARSAQNAHYARALLRAAESTRNGMSLREALKQTEWLPPYLIDVIETGELTGDLGLGLDQLAEILEEDGKRAAAQAVFWILFGGLLLIALCGALLALSLLFGVSGH